VVAGRAKRVLDDTGEPALDWQLFGIAHGSVEHRKSRQGRRLGNDQAM